MYDLPKNTIFSYLSNPLFDKLDFSELPVSMLAREVEDFKRSSKSNPAPETEALKFYFLNHAFHTMKSKFNALESLDEGMIDIAEKHIKITNLVAKRLFLYSTIICVEEARFIHDQDDAFFSFMEGSYGKQFVDYMNNGFSTDKKRGSLTSFGDLDMTCGEFINAMVSVFAFGKWSPGYGGRGWTPIASLISETIHGHISFESMADQAFSLCHNNGSMFNKGHMYAHYTQFIYTILDIQDSGQIPQWIHSNKSSNFIDKELGDIFKTLVDAFPNEMSGTVNKALVSTSAKNREKKAAAILSHNYNHPSGLTQQSIKQNATVAKHKKQTDVLLSGMGIKPKV